MLYFELTIWSIFYRRQNKILYLVGLSGIELHWENFWFGLSLSALGSADGRWQKIVGLAVNGDKAARATNPAAARRKGSETPRQHAPCAGVPALLTLPDN